MLILFEWFCKIQFLFCCLFWWGANENPCVQLSKFTQTKNAALNPQYAPDASQAGTIVNLDKRRTYFEKEPKDSFKNAIMIERVQTILDHFLVNLYEQCWYCSSGFAKSNFYYVACFGGARTKTHVCSYLSSLKPKMRH